MKKQPSEGCKGAVLGLWLSEQVQSREDQWSLLGKISIFQRGCDIINNKIKLLEIQGLQIYQGFKHFKEQIHESSLVRGDLNVMPCIFYQMVSSIINDLSCL